MWQTTSSRVAYQNQWIRVVEDQVVRPDGSPGIYGVVELAHPAVFVVALDDDDRMLLLTVDRYTSGKESIEIPAGASDGEEPLFAAQRELLEETGMVADFWTQVGEMDALNGIARAPEVVFIVRGVRPHVAADAAADLHATDSLHATVEPHAHNGHTGYVGETTAGSTLGDHQTEEGISNVTWVPFARVLAMIGAGEIRDGESIAAIALAAVRLGRFR